MLNRVSVKLGLLQRDPFVLKGTGICLIEQIG